MRFKNNAIAGYGLMAMAGIFWGTSGIFGSIVMASGVTSGCVGVFRLGIGAFFLGLIILFYNPSLFSVGWKGLVSIGLMGLVTQSAMNYTYFRAISLTTPSTAVVLLYTCPIFLLVYGMLIYKEKLTIKKVLAVVACLTGCYLAVTEGSTANLAFNAEGLLYGVGAGISYASLTICSKELLKRYHTLTILFYGFIAGSMGLAILAVPIDIKGITLSPGTVLAVIGLGLFSGTLAYVCYVSGLSCGVETSKAGILASLEVVSGVILAFLILKESMSIYKVIGVAAVFGSILLVNQPAREESVVKSEA